MKHLCVLSVVLISLCAPAVAQEEGEEEGGLSLMERGAQMLMEGMLKELEPALEGLDNLGPSLRAFAQEMGPALAELMDEVKDWSAYEPPEVLPNGDIIIRKKPPEDLAPPEGDQVDI